MITATCSSHTNATGPQVCTGTKKRVYSRANFEGIKADIRHIDWKDKVKNMDVEGMWNMYTDILEESTARNVPTVEVSMKKYVVPIQKSTRDLIKEKDRLHRKITELKRQNKWSKVKNETTKYNRTRNKVRKDTRHARRNLEEDKR